MNLELDIVAAPHDIPTAIIDFLSRHAPKESMYFADRGVIAWHIFRRRVAWRMDQNGLTAVMFYWQLKDIADIDNKILNEIEGEGQILYIALLAIDERVRFEDLIGGMLDYAIDSCEERPKFIAFERLDNRVRQYKIREKHEQE